MWVPGGTAFIDNKRHVILQSGKRCSMQLQAMPFLSTTQHCANAPSLERAPHQPEDFIAAPSSLFGNRSLALTSEQFKRSLPRTLTPHHDVASALPDTGAHTCIGNTTGHVKPETRCHWLCADQEAPASAVLDLGTLVDAIHVAAGAHLELQRLRIPNSGNRRLTRPSERVRLRVAGIFALWPSVTLARNSRVRNFFCS